ncbi:hypothetical protein L7F22_064816 [Adiantum nelumboides]|nr:hypothetical protein [Adiantum nelumboides]
MQEIASATHNFQDFNEIMPAIYRNFMEREAREWRQIYKALQLLEYIIKHGSERVVDDARSHLSTIKILRSFHYIDEAGKDQGINVRNRAKEISELLSDVERIRQERRRARANKAKYQGASNSDFVPGSGSGRYGGFGSDSYYGGSGGAGGSSSFSGGGGGAQRESFDEYDAGDYEEGSASAGTRASSRPSAQGAAKKKEPAPAAKVADLFSFDDDDDASSTPAPPAPSKAPAASTSAASDGFDDFDDFQAAPSQSAATATTSAPAPAPAARPSNTAAAKSGGNVFDFLGGDETAATAPAPSRGSASTTSGISSTPLSPQQRPQASRSTTATSTSSASQQPAKNSLNFDDLWASSAGKSSAMGSGAGGANKGKMSLAEMAKQKSNSAVWASGSAQQPPSTQNKSDPFDFL